MEPYSWPSQVPEHADGALMMRQPRWMATNCLVFLILVGVSACGDDGVDDSTTTVADESGTEATVAGSGGRCGELRSGGL